MKPDEVNAVVANQAFELVLQKVPNTFGLKNISKKVIICILDSRLREALSLVFFHLIYSHPMVLTQHRDPY